MGQRANGHFQQSMDVERRRSAHGASCSNAPRPGVWVREGLWSALPRPLPCLQGRPLGPLLGM